MGKIFIVDGNSLLFRSFYALYRPGMDIMRASDGTPTNAIYSFNNMMKKIKSELKEGERMVVCFDTGKKTFRSAELESYKMNRKPLDPELKAQLPLSRELLDCFNIFHCELEGYEADDLAGSLAKYASSKGDEVVLFTSDKDYLQLLDQNVTVRFLRKGLSEIETFTKDNIKEKMGFEADQVTDYKGLVGDPSDNIKGVKGVGEKTALKLIEKYGHIEDILEGIKEDKSKVALNILENKDVALFCKRIATIKTDLDVKDYYESSLLKKDDEDKLLKFYKKLDFNKFYNELKKKIESESALFDMFEEKECDFKGVKEVDNFSSIKDPLSVLVKNSDSNFHKGKVEGFYLANEEECFYLNVENALKDEGFKDYLTSSKVKYTYNLKGLLVALNKIGLPFIKNVEFDLLLATYLLDTNVKQTYEGMLDFFEIGYLDSTDLLGLTALSVNKLHQKVIDMLQKNEQYNLYKDVELPLTTVLAKMEIEGFPIDRDVLESINVKYKMILEDIKKTIFALIGHELNLNSPRQVGELIYDELQLKKKGKSMSTDIDVLKSLIDKHPVISYIIEYRKYNKIVSSYTEALKDSIYEDDKIHAIYNQALTTTGRLSMSEPNLQNISIRDEEGKEIRKAFFYKDHKYKLLSFDYSQIELRMLASIANIPDLIEVFNSSKDIHTSTAMKVFNVEENEVTSLMRRKAKAVNFGIVYGISDWGLAQQIDVSPMEAHDIIANFYDAYKGLKEYEDNTIEFAKKEGYAKTILNRRRYLPNINSLNRNLREFSYRAAVNTTIQGSAADLIKVAMIEIDKLLDNYNTKMVLQIHDELIFKVDMNEYDELKDKIKNIMENAIKLRCKLEVEGDLGDTWFDCK